MFVSFINWDDDDDDVDDKDDENDDDDDDDDDDDLKLGPLLNQKTVYLHQIRGSNLIRI